MAPWPTALCPGSVFFVLWWLLWLVPTTTIVTVQPTDIESVSVIGNSTAASMQLYISGRSHRRLAVSAPFVHRILTPDPIAVPDVSPGPYRVIWK